MLQEMFGGGSYWDIIAEVQHHVKLNLHTPTFCYLTHLVQVKVQLDEASRARVRCACDKFKELSPIRTARSASYFF